MKFLVLATSILALNRQEYPAEFAIPAPVPAWTSAFLGGVSIPDIPVRSKELGPTGIVDNSEGFQGCYERNDWALTYDDGSSEFTPQVLDQLQARNMKATFFVVGSQLLRYPEVLIRTYREGHQIAMHSWSHNSLVTLTNEEIVAEMVWTSKIIKDIIGVAPKFVRVPFGESNRRVAAVLRAMGLETIFWNRDSFDWRVSNFDRVPNNEFTPQSIVDLFQSWSNERIGVISLQHDVFQPPVSIVGSTLDILARSRFSVKTVAECVSIQPYFEFITTVSVQFASSPQGNSFSPQINRPRLPTGPEITTVHALHRKRIKELYCLVQPIHLYRLLLLLQTAVLSSIPREFWHSFLLYNISNLNKVLLCSVVS
jgi:peptidoglycan/xylan/chitin deacetylase (PgdA/CDA1 family)